MGKVAGLSLVLALSCMGCESDGANKQSAGDAITGDAGARVDAGQKPLPAFPGCDRTQTPDEVPTYSGKQPMFTEEQLTKCQATCKGKDLSCFVDANCPGIGQWDDCAFTNLIACVGSKGKSCRTQLENFDCCRAASGCDPESDDPSCVRTDCADMITAFQTCYDADVTCNQEAPKSCFSTRPSTP